MIQITLNGEPLHLDVTYTKGRPGYILGPPEFCYPPEPAELEINAVYYKGLDVTSLLIDLEEQLIEAAYDVIDAGSPPT